MEEKYIDLLLNRCLCVKNSTPLFINYNKINKDFVDKITASAKNIGITDIYLNEIDSYYIKDLLKELSIEEIKKHEAFNSSIWDEYAKKDAAFLMLDSEIPGLMDDVDSEKIATSAATRRITKPIYREKQQKSQLAWCIAALPNIYWAKDILPDSNNPLEDFWNLIAKTCMLDTDSPIDSWNNLLEEQAKYVDKLNKLEITKLYYKNSLGTNLEIELPEKALWQSASSRKWIVNMPSYEIFTTPNYKTTNGIVYSSKPLIYTGKIIDEFYLKFENGKVTEYKALEGEDVLKEILKGDNLSSALGEVALVNYDSPISNTNILFKSTLFDENASCHLALGSGFRECIKNGEEMSDEELEEKGINISKNHVDFMIGTDDLVIEADTNKGHITIMEHGNLII